MARSPLACSSACFFVCPFLLMPALGAAALGRGLPFAALLAGAAASAFFLKSAVTAMVGFLLVASTWGMERMACGARDSEELMTTMLRYVEPREPVQAF